MTLKVSSSSKAGGPALGISRDERVFAAEPVFDASVLCDLSGCANSPTDCWRNAQRLD